MYLVKEEKEEIEFGKRKVCSEINREYIRVKHTGPLFSIQLLTGREFCLSQQYLLEVDNIDPDSYEVMADGWIRMKKDVLLKNCYVEKATRQALATMQKELRGTPVRLVEIENTF